MSKGNTLLNYFSKTPKRKENSESSNGCNLSNDKVEADSLQYKEGTLLWTKLDGYPWWPSVVIPPPGSQRVMKGLKNPSVHVHFFDDPPSRAWVKVKNVKPYQGSEAKEVQRLGKFYSNKPERIAAQALADKAMKLSFEEIKAMVEIREQERTEEEKEEDKEEAMDVSDVVKDIDFDDDIFDQELDSSKENDETAQNSTVTPEKPNNSQKTPQKTPGGRPKRTSQAKRRKVVESDGDEDSADEFKPGKKELEGEVSSEDGSSGEEEAEEEEVESDESDASIAESPVKQKGKRKRPAATPKTKPSLSPPSSSSKPKVTTPLSASVSSKTKSKLAAFSAPESSASADDTGRTFPHLSLEFLQPDRIKDGNKRKKDDPDYCPRTLFVPPEYLNRCSPAMRQWWALKAQHFDTVLFFKMGKFYELFHMDAVISVSELGLIYMKGEHAHAGFPEIAYGRYADMLIQKGYKVARIEQTETPAMMEERVKNTFQKTKFDKVVRREICSVQTKGTKRYSFIDGDSTEASNHFLLAICEKEESEGVSEYGVCFIDTSIGKFHLGQFQDDRFCSRLRTLISHYTPVHVLYERGKISGRTLTLINSTLSTAIKEALRPGSEFWDSGTTLKKLIEAEYFQDTESKEQAVPEVIKAMQDPVDNLGFTAAIGHDLELSALGAVVWYLQDCLMDEEIVSLRLFEKYEPIDSVDHPVEPSSTSTVTLDTTRRMVLDAVALANLDVVVNSSTGTSQGTLLEQLDYCKTPFGKRLLKQWLVTPLCNPDAINDRLDAIDDLRSCSELLSEIPPLMSKLPDLERQLSKIHTLGNARRSKNHPDSRAIYFEQTTYSKRKIDDFLSTLAGFKLAQNIIKKFKDSCSDFKSNLLKQAVSFDPDGRFPDLTEELQFFENAFDHKKARADGTIKPSRGVDNEFDTAMDGIQKAKTDLEDYLKEQKKELSCRSITYWGTGKNHYQMEIPEHQKVPDSYMLMSSKKGVKRYRTTEIEEMLVELASSEEHKETAVRDIMRRIFHRFDSKYQLWENALQCLSVLDVLLSFTSYAASDSLMCRPQVLLPADTQPFIEIREGKHPCMGRAVNSVDFIPNDTVIGKSQNEDSSESDTAAQLVIVTGPNMGGKSTLMRQVGAVIILAQLGCYVPAETCRLTPVDRIFSRLGASDRIMAGESTFFVELSETSAILQHATQHSLVLMDELGRGTATYDGTAIACSVVRDLSTRIKCRTLFSTHYHSLVDEFTHDSNIRTGHMACMVENESDNPSEETITFLYKFIEGVCPKSYGFNAARLANIPEQVIQLAHSKAANFHEEIENIKLFRKLCSNLPAEEILQTVTELQSVA